jgi:hypothetical protein
MTKTLLLLAIAAGILSAQEGSLLLANPAPAPKLWKASLTTLAVANVLDIHSSWGKHEINSVLSGPSGTFGGRGALTKVGLQGGLMGLELWLTRGRAPRKVYRVLTVVNFGASAVIAGVAAHNYTVPRPR